MRHHGRSAPALTYTSLAVNPRHVYIHVPFCARRCSYCDFAIAVRRIVPVEEYVTSVAREIALRFPGAAAQVSTIYLGGGTPSRLGADGIARLLEVVRRRFDVASNGELTIEANPDDITLAEARTWRAAGVNRISLGAQSFDVRSLQWMHRVHDAAAIPEAFEVLRTAGFNDVSLDLIFALPESLKRDWRADLERAIALDPTHISLYGLTVEPHAPLGRWVARGEAAEAPEERYAAEYLLAHSMLAAAGFEHYEVSNFAKPGHRAKHNFAYWQHVAYAGVGPGAHEFDGQHRRWNTGNYAEWVRRLAAGTDPKEGDELLSAENRLAEQVYLGLRTADGLVISPEEARHVTRWVEAAWGSVDGERLRLTAHGWLRLDTLAADLTLFRSR
jgi:oxygen-independent coproporphyrinogen-3 oxidase